MVSLCVLCNSEIVCSACITVALGNVRNSDGFDGNALNTWNGSVADLHAISIGASATESTIWNSLVD